MALYDFLKPENALIFRITHLENLADILETGGLHARSSTPTRNYVNIGNTEIISLRAGRTINIEPYGSLNDYVPFYFTPSSIMLFNIITGKGVPQKPASEIVMFMAQLTQIQGRGIPFIFTDRHALLRTANYYGDLRDLDKISWPILQNRDFKRDYADLGKFERYMAEALIHRFVPLDAISAIVCATQEIQDTITNLVTSRNLNVRIMKQPTWFFI